MKSTFKSVLLAAAICFAYSGASAQQRKNAVKINFIAPLFSTLNVHTEHALNEKSSVCLFGFAGFGSATHSGIGGWGIGAEYRYYLNGEPLKGGFYAAPYLRYRDMELWAHYTRSVDNVVVEETDKTIPVAMFGGGVVLGKQWALGNRIVIDIFLGPDFNSSNMRSYDKSDFDIGIFSNLLTGYGVRFGSTVGFKL